VGSGQDTIDYAAMYSFNGVQMGVMSADVTASRVVNSPNDLVLNINGTTDSLTIKGYFTNPGTQILFSDGMIWWDSNQLANLPVLFEGTEGADNLAAPAGYLDQWGGWHPASSAIMNGNGGDDTLTGADGFDLLNGGAGNDTLNGGAGDDILSDTAGANLLDGGAGIDTLSGNSGNEMFVGGTGDDIIDTGAGADILAFNLGDGMDVVNGGIGADNTISLGGGISYADLALSKVNNDLILEVGNGDQITLANWYDTAANYKSVIDLQVMADAMAGFDPASGDPLMNRAVQNFDFTAIVNAFDQAHGGSATYMHWSATGELLAAHLSGSDTMALGGDLAHQYGSNGSFTGMNLAAAQTVLNDPQFGGAQTLNPLQGLQGGAVTL
jgi:Ca2+-binding RTX toxin-like protein